MSTDSGVRYYNSNIRESRPHTSPLDDDTQSDHLASRSQLSHDSYASWILVLVYDHIPYHRTYILLEKCIKVYENT